MKTCTIYRLGLRESVDLLEVVCKGRDISETTLADF